MKTLVGIRPTGRLHIGHYFSVIKPALKENADVLVARYHAPSGDWKKLVNDLKLNLGIYLYYEFLQKTIS